MIELQQLEKKYGQFIALRNINLTISKGEIHGIIGASGSGKSTLLRMMNLLEKPDNGEVIVNHQHLQRLKKSALYEARKQIGMIFQKYQLVSNKTVFDNVLTALEIANYPKKKRHDRVSECLKFVGLQAHELKYPRELSGGQQQRVAIARALANKPNILLCDEPTSALDPSTTDEILAVLQSINQELGVTIVLVSHEMSVIKKLCTTVTVLEDGAIYETLQLVPLGVTRGDASAKRFVEELRGGGTIYDS